MKKLLVLPLLLVSIMSWSQFNALKKQAEQYVPKDKAAPALSQEEVGNGLKEALEKGCQSAVDKGGASDGYYKNPKLFIPFPEEATKVKTYALKAGMKNQVEDFERSMNRAAEAAASTAIDILVKAVLEMTIQDAWKILKGEENAATDYLKEKAYASLYEKFLPISKKAIEEVEVTKYWNPLASAYNKTTFMTGEKKINPDLDKYITEKALEGMFLLISDQEKLIRKDPLSRTTDLLKKVFEQQ